MSGTHPLPTKYRPEIDGLRAVAVIPVIFFHAGLTAFSGGYVGVDVFFVISGYLITSIIVDALKEDRFSFSDFYYNRAKRILPALFFVLLLTIPAAIYLMLPDDLAAFGKSSIYALTFLANFYYKKSADYFAPSSEQLPLLHTWSLAVEEQFYLIFPVILSLTWRFGRKFVFRALVLTLVVSFLLSILGIRNFPVSNYYMLPTRAWELLAGALIVFWLKPEFLQPYRMHRLLSNGMPLLGLLMIVYSIFAFDKLTPYPGPMTLLPVLGTTLIILFSTDQGIVKSLLSWRPLVFLGGMSYSLYLWHFPVFALNNIYQARYGASISMGVLFCFLIGAAYFSLVFVERPLRHLTSSKLKVSASFCAASVLMIATGWLLQSNTHLFKEYKPAQLQFMAAQNHDVGALTWDRCSAVGMGNACEGGDLQAVKKVILFGDSHSYTLFHSLSEELRRQGRKLILLTDGNCPPVFISDQVFAGDKCIDRSRAIYETILEDRDVESVVLVARWSWYIHGQPFDNLQGGIGEKSSNFLAAYQKGGEGRIRLMTALFEETFRSLTAAGINTVLVNTIPEPGWNVRKKTLHMLGDTTLDQISLAYDTDVFSKRNSNFDETLAKFDGASNFMVVHPSEVFCDTTAPLQCTSLMRGALLYMDDNHLSYLGSKLVSKQIVQALGISK